MSSKGPQLRGRPVLTGSGDLLGHVVDVLRQNGAWDAIVVEQVDGAKRWIVEREHVKFVDHTVYLKGPREGFHIAPLRPPKEASTLVPKPISSPLSVVREQEPA